MNTDAKENVKRIQAEKDARLEAEDKTIPAPTTSTEANCGADIIAELEDFLAELKRKHAINTPTVIGPE